MTEKTNVEGLQLRVSQLDGELETIRDRICQYGLEEIFETKSEAEDNDELVDKTYRARCIENLLTPV